MHVYIYSTIQVSSTKVECNAVQASSENLIQYCTNLISANSDIAGLNLTNAVKNKIRNKDNSDWHY